MLYKDGLSRANEITSTVTGRNSGRTVSLPIWLVRDSGIAAALSVAMDFHDAQERAGHESCGQSHEDHHGEQRR